MPRRHPHPARLPRRWLMTDERMGDALWQAIDALPRGSGVVFRHYAMAPAVRRALLERVRRAARSKGLLLIEAGPPLGLRMPRHGREKNAFTAPVHSRGEAVAAIRRGAALLFVSPVHATRSHPGARSLGTVRLGLLIRGLKAPVVALGGMDERRWRALKQLGVHGWAGIDAWTKPRVSNQKRIAVPT